MIYLYLQGRIYIPDVETEVNEVVEVCDGRVHERASFPSTG